MAKKGKAPKPKPKPKLSLRRRIWRGAVVLSVIAALFFGVLAFSAMVDEDGQMGWRLRLAGGADPVSEYRLLVSYGKPEHHRTAVTYGGLALSRSDYNYEPETNARRRSLLRGIFYRGQIFCRWTRHSQMRIPASNRRKSGGSSGVNPIGHPPWRKPRRSISSAVSGSSSPPACSSPPPNSCAICTNAARRVLLND
ncbi:MAG: hypothetical protein R3F11_19985 [Verrucomicrobiales bacterium]